MQISSIIDLGQGSGRPALYLIIYIKDIFLRKSFAISKLICTFAPT